MILGLSRGMRKQYFYIICLHKGMESKMIKVFTLLDTEAWDSIVYSFDRYDVYYLSGYVKAFEINGDGKAILIYFENDTTRAMNVIMKRDLSEFSPFAGKIGKGELFDIATPYGYGGFLVEGNDIEALKKEYEEFCQSEHIVSEFVRFHPILKNWVGMEELYDECHLGNTVYMDTRSEEIIWKNIANRNRTKIRKAEREGMKVYWCRAPEIIEPFMEIYKATMDKDHAEAYYYFDKKFYESIMEDLKDHAMWFYSVIDGEIAAMTIFLFCNGQMHYHLSASKSKFQKMAATNLLIYEAAVWACRNGYKTLHIGGGVGAGHDGLYQFKKGFCKGDDAEFHIGRKIFDEDVYNRLIALRRKSDSSFNLETGYFPKYKG